MRNIEYLNLFYVDAKKNIIELKKLLELLEKGKLNKNLLYKLFINLNHLKGHSKGMGLRAIQSMTEVLCEFLTEVIQGRLSFCGKVLYKELNSGICTLEGLIEGLKTGGKIKFLVNKAHLGSILTKEKAFN
tara:strand:- start:139 stop:531 length:393 start_codon:yes stop_codon:yes gene_type:complete